MIFKSCLSEKVSFFSLRTHKSCQIFVGTIYQSGEKYSKWLQNYPMPIQYRYPTLVKYSKWPENITISSIQMSSKIYPNIPSGNPDKCIIVDFSNFYMRIVNRQEDVEQIIKFVPLFIIDQTSNFFPRGCLFLPLQIKKKLFPSSE
jgi:hypothetical protein